MIFSSIHQNNGNFFCRKEKKCQHNLRKMAKLAWNLLCETCAKLVEFFRNIVTNPDFLIKHRLSDKNFTRNRKLPFARVIYFLVALPTGSCQKELDGFFKTVNGLDIALSFVTKMAWCKARMKMAYSALIDLNNRMVKYFYAHFAANTWQGFFLKVIDGTTLRLPEIDAIVEHFDPRTPKNRGKCPLARVSQLYDPLNRISCDAIIAPVSQGERDLAVMHFSKLTAGDLVLLDRGYACLWLFDLILSLGADFCARMPANWKCVQQFLKSSKTEQIIRLPLAPVGKTRCRRQGIHIGSFALRLIRIELVSGQTEVLLTSLSDTKCYPHEIFGELYHQRWFVEEDFKTCKCWIELENFTGKSVLSVQQDFHARILSKNLTSMLSFQARETIANTPASGKQPRQINFSHCLSVMKSAIPLLLTRPVDTLAVLLQALSALFLKSTEPVRPGRSYPRKPKRTNDFYPCYKGIG